MYILEHYELEMVNGKIEATGNEEVKYFVVRKILKIIRRIKKEQLLLGTKNNNNGSSKSTKDK